MVIKTDAFMIIDNREFGKKGSGKILSVGYM